VPARVIPRDARHAALHGGAAELLDDIVRCPQALHVAVVGPMRDDGNGDDDPSAGVGEVFL
jgi:hypothetical protein